MNVFLAGASGAVGVECAYLMQRAGHSVTALVRDPKKVGRLGGKASRVIVQDATASAPAMDGMDVVLSCLGASVLPNLKNRPSYRDVDLLANLHLFEAACKAGVGRFVYVSVHLEDAYLNTRYIQAHEEFVGVLKKSKMPYTVIRPTGIFSALASLIPMARKGRVTIVGDGSAKTNPVHQRDVAQLCFAYLEDGPESISVGGPDVLTRKQIAELAMIAVSKPPQFREVSAKMMRIVGACIRPIHPRMGELLEFVTEVATHDCVAPSVGGNHLKDYFTAIAALAETDPDFKP